MTAVGPAALAVSRSPPGARTRAVVSERWAEGCPRDPFFRQALGQGQTKAGSNRTRGRRKRADQTLVGP